MKKTFVEVYELHSASFECDAEIEEAIEMYKNGQADYIDNSADFIETADVSWNS